jgi:hypothetical protein
VVLNAAQGSPGRQLCAATTTSGSELGGPPRSGAVSGDLGVPDFPGGDHSMDVAQDRGGDHGLSLGGLEPVVLAGGQVPVAGTVDRVGALGPPDRSPGSDPQPGPTLAGELGPTGEGARRLLPRCQAGVLD